MGATTRRQGQIAATPTNQGNGGAFFVPPEQVRPKRGRSTVKYPVAVTWVVCENARVDNAGTLPDRSSLVKAAMDEGVTYWTARTQVQEFLAWHNAGRARDQLPRMVELTQRGAQVAGRETSKVSTPLPPTVEIPKWEVPGVIKIDKTEARPPYWYAEFKVKGQRYEVAMDKKWRGIFALMKSRNLLTSRLNVKQRAVELLRFRLDPPTKAKWTEIDMAHTRGPYWHVKLEVYSKYAEFVWDTKRKRLWRRGTYAVSGDKAITWSIAALTSRKLPYKDIHLLELRQEDK